jgi:predicted DNA-binding protein
MSKKQKKITDTSRAKKLMVSIRLSAAARQMLEALSAHHGVDKTAITEIAIRDKYRVDLTDTENR